MFKWSQATTRGKAVDDAALRKRHRALAAAYDEYCGAMTAAGVAAQSFADYLAQSGDLDGVLLR